MQNTRKRLEKNLLEKLKLFGYSIDIDSTDWLYNNPTIEELFTAFQEMVRYYTNNNLQADMDMNIMVFDEYLRLKDYFDIFVYDAENNNTDAKLNDEDKRQIEYIKSVFNWFTYELFKEIERIYNNLDTP